MRALASLGWLGFGVVLFVVGCTKPPEEAPDVEPGEGATQPEPEGSATLTEGEACEALLAATVATEETLGCDERESPLVCPGFLRASAPGCARYAQSTVDECVQYIEDTAEFEDCSDFHARPCIVTAVGAGCGSVADGGPGDEASDAGADAAAP